MRRTSAYAPLPVAKTFVDEAMEQRLRASHRVVPSKMNPWFGSYAEGAKFSTGQLYQLAQDNLAVADVETIEVHVRTTHEQIYVGLRQPLPYRRVICPILRRNGDGSVIVVSPRGMKKVVQADGTPGRARRHG